MYHHAFYDVQPYPAAAIGQQLGQHRMQQAQRAAQQPAEVPGCPVRLVISEDYEKEDGSDGLEVLQLPCRVLPCRNLDEPELASMVGVQNLLLAPTFW